MALTNSSGVILCRLRRFPCAVLPRLSFSLPAVQKLPKNQDCHTDAELRAIRRVLDDNRYYPFCSEKKVVEYIEGVAADADQGANNFLRSIVTSRMT